MLGRRENHAYNQAISILLTIEKIGMGVMDLMVVLESPAGIVVVVFQLLFHFLLLLKKKITTQLVGRLNYCFAWTAGPGPPSSEKHPHWQEPPRP